MTDNSAEKILADAAADLRNIREEIGLIVFGQDRVIENTIISLIAGGHVLLIGAPGLAKTLLVETISKTLGLESKRVQCTPDLMPSDVLGTEVLDQNDGMRNFRFIEGPVFSQLLMADEINRASPRTQSALLQAMQERRVTVNGKPHDLPVPFHVLATQNPIEQEGTYPLPEAQLDRFIMQIDVEYPDIEAERRMLLTTTSNEKIAPKEIINSKRLVELQNIVRDIPVGEKTVDAVLSLIRSLRLDENTSEDIKKYISWAPGPRAAQSLMIAAKARALYEGRGAPSIDDVKELALPVLKHRMALNYTARADQISVSEIIKRQTALL